MRKFVQTPRKIVLEAQYEKLSMKDVLIVVASGFFGFATKMIIFSYFQIPYMLFYPIATYYFLSPSKDFTKKKNYQVTLQVMFKRRKNYSTKGV
ncbi:hypothetical protein AF435_04500 [Listeria monocytogenes]|uniref:Uncharacterized protein n=1 Tax=Listeria monocytogenes TaxID=1639 RepID=A0AAN3BCH7_LISMN|nr:hypothetical protein [Listeria monocytogenes]EAC3367751.1 hypothetical protein [Listeria monocytogenes]EAC7084980.1 hypothetical protein [Listeria monocytogenes]EAC8542006.1 hypothetical protein [Listeria monocytogenes]EAC8548007.1 hypothetical protein [Listeria monocytogenes]